MFNVNFAFLAWTPLTYPSCLLLLLEPTLYMALFFWGGGGNQEKRIFSRSPNISKHNGDDGPNHYNHISNDKIFKVEKMQNS